MIEGVDYFIRLVRFPNRSTPGQVWPNDDGTFDIYVDERLPDDERRRTVEHELIHIREGHFWSPLSIRNCEREADGRPVDPFAQKDYIPEFASLDALKRWAQSLRR